MDISIHVSGAISIHVSGVVSIHVSGVISIRVSGVSFLLLRMLVLHCNLWLTMYDVSYPSLRSHRCVCIADVFHMAVMFWLGCRSLSVLHSR